MAARASWIEIDRGAIRHNLRLIRRLAGAARVYAVCKGHGYGVGAALVARLAADEQIDALACSDPEDVREIRAAGIDLPILLYGATRAADLPALAPLGIIVTAHDAASLEVCLAHDLAFFLKLDTGLHRMGFGEDSLAVVLAAARSHPKARLRGLYTHFSDLDTAGAVSTQAMRFNAMAARIEDAGWRGRERMVASSRVLLQWRSLAFDAVNPGRLVYGLLEAPWNRDVDCRPALSAVKACVIALQRVAADDADHAGRKLSALRSIAIVPFGFRDGYPRLPVGGTALVRGRRVPIIGMRHAEHCMLDVTAVADIALGDEVVFLGAQGRERIDMHELSAATGVPLIELIPRLADNPRRRLLGA